MSLLMRECGLKQLMTVKLHKKGVVIPYAGVWIETFHLLTFRMFLMSLLMRECGLKHCSKALMQ